MPTVRIELMNANQLGLGLGLSRELIDTLGIPLDYAVVVRAGRKQTRARIRLMPDAQADRVSIGSALRQRLSLPSRLTIHLKRHEDGSLEFGPFFGILARVVPKGAPYGEQNRDFRVHMALGKRRGVSVYSFAPADLNLKRGLVRARLYDEGRKRWIRRMMPLPHVFWNRSYWPGTRNRSLLTRTVRSLRRAGVRPFNPGVGTKWQVYRLLWPDSQLRPHIPRTERYQSVRTVLRLLDRFPGVYMKPLWGGWGIGIMRIRRLPRSRYRVSRTIGRSGRNWSRVVSASGLRTVVHRLVDGPYLVQQEIPLAQLAGRLSDVRVLAQRRADGAWGITGAVVRVGKPRSVISNLHGGGRALEIHQALSRMFPSEPKVEQIIERIHTLALAIVEKVESRFGRFGEIGLDFGVDQTGHVWFIEVNSRPGRHSFRITSPDDVWLASSANPVEYAKRLADFGLTP